MLGAWNFRFKSLTAQMNRIGIAISIIVLISWMLIIPYVYPKEKQSDYRNVSNMSVDSDEFWLARAQDQGLSAKGFANDTTLLSASFVDTTGHKTCGDFFVLWPGDCIESHNYLDERMRTLSAQMVVMNATLNFFTTDTRGCSWDKYPGVKIQVFNATEELISYGFSTLLPIINRWDKTRFTRLSDILRLCIAHRHRMSYLDSDVHFLSLQKGWYQIPYVGAQLWSDSKNAIEITNAAFCLPRNILKDMVGYQHSVILRKQEGIKNKYFYTELGPSMFHHVLLNRRAVALYSQNHPAQPSLDSIARDIHLFAHKQLHLTGSIRKGNKNLKFDQLVNAIRRKSGLPELNILPSTII